MEYKNVGSLSSVLPSTLPSALPSALPSTRTMLRTSLLVMLVFVALGSRPAHAILQTYGIIGDTGHPTDSHFLTRRSLEKHDVFNLILPGDNIYDEDLSYGDIWNSWRSRGFQFPVVAIGNHTLGYREEMRYFRLPAEFYSYKRHDARYIVLNSDNTDTVDLQMRFLRQELESARETFIFLVYHHPTFTLTDRHGWKEKEDFQKGIRYFLKRYGKRVTAVIVGHDHITSLLDINGVPMIVSGSAMEQIPTRPLDYSDDGFHVKTKWLFRDGPHWVRLDADADFPHVWVNMVSAERNSVVCSARIFPRPILMEGNCQKSNSRAKPVRVPLDPRPRDHEDEHRSRSRARQSL